MEFQSVRSILDKIGIDEKTATEQLFVLEALTAKEIANKTRGQNLSTVEFTEIAKTTTRHNLIEYLTYVSKDLHLSKKLLIEQHIKDLS